MATSSKFILRALLQKQIFPVSGNTFRWYKKPLVVRIAIMMLFFQSVLIMGVLAISRTDVVPEIKTVDAIYFPGNILPRESGECFAYDFIYRSCSINLSGQKIYFTVNHNTHMISRTGIRADAYRIGDLIRAWGYPSGYSHQPHGPSIVSWGNRAAIIDEQPLRPESRVDFIQYDLDATLASAWKGFGNYKTAQ